MIRFILSFTAIWFAVYGWNHIVDNYLLTTAIDVLLVYLIPTLASASTAILLHTKRPLRLFDAPAKDGLGPVLLGTVTGLMSLGLAAFFLVLMGDNANSSMIQFCSSVGATLIVLMLFGGRRKAGLCRQCGYDIQASLDFGRCPECGIVI